MNFVFLKQSFYFIYVALNLKCLSQGKSATFVWSILKKEEGIVVQASLVILGSPAVSTEEELLKQCCVRQA